MPSLSGQVIGGYRLLDQIGQGGMASVYRAQRLGEDRYFAFKIITPLVAQHEQFVKRFEREVQVVSRLHHPRIVPVIHFGEIDGRAFLVMPYLTGGNLSERIVKKPLSAGEGARVMNHIAAGLAFAHERGIVHRDVKPSNILLDDDGNAYLSDFGLAQIADASLSLTGSALIGTPAYISPEQARGDHVDARSDQYALGIVLFQISTGALPFDADTPIGVLMKHLNESLPRPRDVNPTVPIAVERVILKATAKEPGDRFASVADMNAALQAALAHAMDPRHTAAPPLIPLPPSATQTLAVPGRPALDRRRPWWIGAGALLVVALCGTAMTASAALTGWPFSLDPPTRQAASADGSPLQLTEKARTIAQLSTQVAASGLQEGDLEQAVAQTLTAMQAGTPGALPLEGSLLTEDLLSATPTPTGFGFPTSTPHAPGLVQGTQGSGYRTATPTNPPPTAAATGGGPIPTAGASSVPPTATAAPLPPTDSPTTDPAPTSPPAATKAPKPTKTPKCSGHSCTATPGP
jgi:serine/threonine-protein kinase